MFRLWMVGVAGLVTVQLLRLRRRGFIHLGPTQFFPCAFAAGDEHDCAVTSRRLPRRLGRIERDATERRNFGRGSHPAIARTAPRIFPQGSNLNTQPL